MWIRKPCIVAGLCVTALSSHAEIVFATCDHVVDGDTFYFVSETDTDKKPIRARLAGIDCPESRQRAGAKAKANLKILIYGKRLELDLLGKDSDTETWICTVEAEGIDPARIQATQGLAWLNPDDVPLLSFNRIDKYDTLIYEAQSNRWGLWKDRRAEPPWEFRAKEQRRKIR